MPDPRAVRLAQVLVDYSINVHPGERVAISAQTPAAPLVEAVFERVLERGGHPHLLLQLPGLEALFLKHANDAQLAYISPFLSLAAGEFEGHISLGGESNTRELSAIDPARQAIQRKAREPVLKTYFQRSADGQLRWVVAQYPTDANAQDAEMSLRDYEDFVYGACHVDDPAADPVAYWRGVSAEQQRLADWMKPHDRIAIRGPNVDLTL